MINDVMVRQILHAGFASTHRHIGLILFDVLWKALWLFVTFILFGLFLIRIGLELRSIPWEGAGFSSANPLLALTLLRQFWNAYAANVFWGGVILLTISAFAWFLLEAYFRSGLLARTAEAFAGNVSVNFKVFLASGIARTVVLLGAVLLVGATAFGPYLVTPLGEWPALWEETGGVAVIGAAILVVLGFLLTIADTLIRSDAVRLFGTHMLEIAGLIGTLLLFETLISVSAAVVVVTAVLHVSTPLELIVAIAGALAAVLVLSAVHSYLLVVRFISIGIMKRDDTDV